MTAARAWAWAIGLYVLTTGLVVAANAVVE